MSEQPSKGEICGALRTAGPDRGPDRPCPEPPGHEGPHDPHGDAWVQRPLSELIASVCLPHQARASGDSPGLLVRAGATGVHVGERLLSPQQAHELSRAVRAALVARRSSTVRPFGGQRPVMVCRVSDAAVRVDGQVFTRDEGVQLAVALDLAAHQVQREPDPGLELAWALWGAVRRTTSYMLC